MRQAAGEKGEQFEQIVMTSPANVISNNAAISAGEKGSNFGHDAQHGSLTAYVISSNAAISACEQGWQGQRVAPLLDEKHSRGMLPNMISFSAAISFYAKGWQWQRVAPLFFA